MKLLGKNALFSPQDIVTLQRLTLQMSVLWAEHIKPRCKGSGTLMAKSGIRSEFPQRSCRLRVAILMGFVCHLEKGINKNALMHCEELPGE